MTSKYNLRIKFFTYCNIISLENIIDQLKDGVTLKINRIIHAAAGHNMEIHIDCAGYSQITQERHGTKGIPVYHLKLTNIQRISFLSHINAYLSDNDYEDTYFFTVNEYTKSLCHGVIY
jgi:hypothetical protein